MITITKNKNLKGYNTFNLSCIADLFVEFDNIEDIQEYLSIKNANDKKFFVLGGGSNVLLSEKFSGIIYYPKIVEINIISENNESVLLKVGSSIVWDDFVKYTVDNNLYGAENLSLIPGTVGASAVQNIGAYGVEAKDIIEKVEYLEIETSKLKEIDNIACDYAYRDSIFKNELSNKIIITNVYFSLSKKANFNLNYGNLKDVLKNYNEINLTNIRDAVIKVKIT
jgi:UDP-N-acetylmuramate dehydrogenase